MQLVSKINELILSVFSDHTPFVMNVEDNVSFFRLELAFLYHEKHSFTCVLSVEYMSN